MELAIQFDLLAQGPNFEDWGEVLVIAIMALLWLAGGLAKVLSSRKGPQQRPPEGPADQPTRKRETWQERLARKAHEMQQAAEAKGRQLEQEARARTQTAQPRPARATDQPSPPAGRVAVRTDHKGDSVLVYERSAAQSVKERDRQAASQREARKAVSAAARQATKSASVQPRVETGGPAYERLTEGLTATMREPPSPLEPGLARSQIPREPVGALDPADIIDYSDPDALRKAVLHFEILGKPLALREPSDETISF
jgi:hypothetical protein